jgi:hypothetical protein
MSPTAGASLEEFARVARAEHRIEQCFERGKTEAGLAEYRVLSASVQIFDGVAAVAARSWRGQRAVPGSVGVPSSVSR